MDLGMDIDQWPEETREAYAQLKLPSLYDMVLSNEKLAVEIRRQNRDLQNLRECIENKHEEAIEVMQNEQERCVQEKLQHTEEWMISLMDSLQKLVLATQQTKEELLAILPKKEGWLGRRPEWREKAERITDSFYKGTEMIYEKLLLNLKKMGIELIYPEKGEPFCPTLHHAIEQSSGGISGTIAEVFRVGYQRDDEVLRYAEVCVFK